MSGYFNFSNFLSLKISARALVKQRRARYDVTKACNYGNGKEPSVNNPFSGVFRSARFHSVIRERTENLI